MPKIPKTFRLATLLTMVTSFAIGIAVVQYFSDSSAYKRNRDVTTLRKILSTQIQPGDSVSAVLRKLGPAEWDDGTNVAKLLQWKNSKAYNPISFPEGIEEHDKLAYFEAKPKRRRYSLQFRNERLVNFNPKDFEGPDNVIEMLKK